LSTQPRHIVVLGGGALGISTAAHLIRKGVDVTVVTDSELASGASGRSLSWLNSAGARSPEYHAFRMAGIERYRELKAEHPEVDWLEFGGGVFWGTGADPARARHDAEVAKNYSSRLLDPRSLSEEVPGINVEAVNSAVVFNPEEGWVSLPHLIGYLSGQITEGGGRIITDAGTSTVLTEDGRAVGVRTAAGEEHRGDAVVVACGPQTPEVVADLGVNIADASPLSMLVTSEPFEVPAGVVLNTPRAAVRPNPGSTVAIDHDWYEDRIVTHEDGTHDIPQETVDELVAEAVHLYAGAPDIRAATWSIGRKPIPGDGEPVFGELDAVPGCYAIFTHSGATLALIGGELAANELVNRTEEEMLARFRPERFAAAAEHSV
jgi:glycine/D-amino acid oxidase-like deaminating enzyme